jgi:broad specificity phosphatase PhoE
MHVAGTVGRTSWPPTGDDTVELLIVQHAEKEPHGGNPGLTPRGMEQAAALGRWLHRQRPVDAVFSSPLRRARETAEQIAIEMGIPSGSIVLDQRLRERMNWEGEHVQPYDAFLVEWRATFADRDYQPTHGDSARAAGERFAAFVHELRERYSEGRLVVVSHGGVTLDLALTLFGERAIRRRSPNILEEGPSACAVTRIQTIGQELVLHSIGTQYMLR